MSKKPHALIILDGFGLTEPGDSNACHLANTPNFDRLWNKGLRTRLIASGEEVGLPPGQMGNSEVGHLNLGAGRVVMQSLSYINHQIKTGEFFQQAELKKVMERVGEDNSLHIMGLASRGRVHSDLEHLFALINMARDLGARPIFLHLFTDGRDCAPDSGAGFVKEVEDFVESCGSGVAIASVSGRYFAMDRDNRWERIEKAYEAVVNGASEFRFTSPSVCVESAYERGETDEFIQPSVLIDDKGEARGPICNGDSIIFFNFRADRGREMTYALMGASDWSEFKRSRVLEEVAYCSLTEYDAAWELPFAFCAPEPELPLAEVLSQAGKTQYHTAETEKYPHVTFFFNAKVEEPYPGETRHLVASPKVATYDLQPEMSAPELTAATVARIEEGLDDFILVNFANPDMVGHTGVLRAAVAACEATDKGLGKIVDALEKAGGCYIIVADHGNCEVMRDEDGDPHTAHTTNLVPCIIGGQLPLKYKGSSLEQRGAKLADVAPTLLELMGIEKPACMTGSCLLDEVPLSP